VSPYIPNTQITTAQVVSATGWVDDSSTTWTYASATTFTVSGDQTVKFSKGTRLQLTQSGSVKYFVVAGSSFGGGTTTVTITGGSDYTLANAAISVNSYSYAANPQGYPSWFSYTPVWTGFSADPPNPIARFSVVGTACTLNILCGTPGTSNATTLTATLPIVPHGTLGYGRYTCRATNNSADLATPGLVTIDAVSVLTAYRDMSAAAWTGSGSKGIGGVFVYEI